jgi:hypothetical protein
MTWSACPNRSLRLRHDVQRTSCRVPLLARGQFDLPPNPSATLLPIIAQARVRKIRHFSAPCSHVRCQGFKHDYSFRGCGGAQLIVCALPETEPEDAG